VYLDVLPLTECGDGRLRVGGEGTTVDWLVKMRRLPAEAMLDALLARGAATPAQLHSVALRLAAFHRDQPAAPLEPAGYRALLLRHIDEYERELREPAGALPQARVTALCARQRTLLGALAACLDARVAQGRIVEGHGDLRTEHVYLGEPPAIIDCLEFSGELRWLDGVDEVGFLALECERARAPALGRVLLQSWRDASGDTAPAALVHFYQSCRACSRARLAIRHLREARYRGSPAWRRRALRYLALADRHLREADATLAPAAR
jgi:aminoglycoside phosphotransferase family enzyme